MKNMRELRVPLLVVLLSCLFGMAGAYAQESWVRRTVHHSDVRNGMPHNYVDYMCQSSEGLMWFALNGGGVAAYDGYSYTVLNIGNQPLLKSDFVHVVRSGPDGWLWVGTDCGLNVFDIGVWQVLPLLCGETDVVSDKSVIYDIAIDKEGDVWVSSPHHVDCFSSDGHGGVDCVGGIDFEDDVTMLRYEGGHVYAASFASLYILQKEEGRLSREAVRYRCLETMRGMVTSLARDGDDLWLGSDVGLFRIGLSTGEERSYRHSDSDNGSLSQNRVTDICLASDGAVVVSTLMGINVYSKESDSFVRITQDNAAQGLSLSSNFVNCLCSTGEALWVGTEVAGVDILSSNSLEVRNFVSSDICALDRGRTASAHDNARPVNAIKEDAVGSLWVGCVEGGLGRKARGESVFAHFTRQNHGLSHNSVSCLETDGQGRLWVGTWGGGVSIMDLNAAGFPVVGYVAGRELGSDFVCLEKYDSINGGMWVGSVREVCFVDDAGLHHPIGADVTGGMNGALGVDIDSRGNLWFGTSQGLVIADLRTYDGESVRYRLIDSKLGAPEVKVSPRVTALCHSSSDRMYVGTNGYGLYVATWSGDSLTFDNISTDDGLSNNTIMGIVEGGDGQLWVSTCLGISSVNLRTRGVVNYTVDDGLVCDNFYWNAFCKSPSTGDAFFGGLTGMVELRTEAHEVGGESRPRAPMLTSLEVSNKLVEPSEDGVLRRVIWQTDDIVFHEEEKSFAVGFSALAYASPSAIRYQYRLDGFDDQWVEAHANQRRAAYTSLQHGKYRLRVRYQLGNGAWSEERCLGVTILPFFYKTVWFALLVGVLLAGGVWMFYRIKMSREREVQRMLKTQVTERTEELRRQKEILESKTLELESKNMQLLERNKQVMEQKESILEMTGRIRKLSVDKLQFFTNISHELRSPLTLISGPVKRALRLTDKPEVREQLQLIDRSAESLLATVNQLMDFRKVDNGNMELHPVTTRIVPLLSDICAPYVAYAAERGIRINLLTRFKAEYVKVDNDMLNKVVSNLLSNAVKYSPDNGKISLYAAEIADEGGLKMYLCVSDQGAGLPPEDIDKVFNRFYQSQNKAGDTHIIGHGGTGIGLYLVHKLVNQSNGMIYARNNKGGGLSMRLLMPIAVGSKGESAIAALDKPKEIVPSADVKGRLKILIVEDSQDMRVYLSSILSGVYDVMEARDGVEALTKMTEAEPGFIIADLMMPGMDGLEFARRVKNDFAYSHIPLLILTAQTSDEYRTECYRVGVDSYLLKPFDEQMLLARISGMIESRHSSQQRFQATLNTEDLMVGKETDDERLIRRITENIKAHFSDPDYSIDVIVEEIGCSKSMLHKKMQSLVGQTPGNFIRAYRLNVARELLSQRGLKRMNVSQVAYECGFNDPKYFSRCFTKFFGYPPSEIN